MAIIPKVTEQQIQPQPATELRVDTDRPNALGALSDLGRTVQNAIGKVGSAVEAYDNMVDESYITSARNKASEIRRKRQKKMEEAKLSLAETVRKDQKNTQDSAYKKAMDMLTNDRQRLLFGPYLKEIKERENIAHDDYTRREMTAFGEIENKVALAEQENNARVEASEIYNNFKRYADSKDIRAKQYINKKWQEHLNQRMKSPSMFGAVESDKLEKIKKSPRNAAMLGALSLDSRDKTIGGTIDQLVEDNRLGEAEYILDQLDRDLEKKEKDRLHSDQQISEKLKNSLRDKIKRTRKSNVMNKRSDDHLRITDMVKYQTKRNNPPPALINIGTSTPEQVESWVKEWDKWCNGETTKKIAGGFPIPCWDPSIVKSFHNQIIKNEDPESAAGTMKLLYEKIRNPNQLKSLSEALRLNDMPDIQTSFGIGHKGNHGFEQAKILVLGYHKQFNPKFKDSLAGFDDDSFEKSVADILEKKMNITEITMGDKLAYDKQFNRYKKILKSHVIGMAKRETVWKDVRNMPRLVKDSWDALYGDAVTPAKEGQTHIPMPPIRSKLAVYQGGIVPTDHVATRLKSLTNNEFKRFTLSDKKGVAVYLDPKSNKEVEFVPEFENMEKIQLSFTNQEGVGIVLYGGLPLKHKGTDEFVRLNMMAAINEKITEESELTGANKNLLTPVQAKKMLTGKSARFQEKRRLNQLLTKYGFSNAEKFDFWRIGKDIKDTNINKDKIRNERNRWIADKLEEKKASNPEMFEESKELQSAYELFSKPDQQKINFIESVATNADNKWSTLAVKMAKDYLKLIDSKKMPLDLDDAISNLSVFAPDEEHERPSEALEPITEKWNPNVLDLNLIDKSVSKKEIDEMIKKSEDATGKPVKVIPIIDPIEEIKKAYEKTLEDEYLLEELDGKYDNYEDLDPGFQELEKLIEDQIKDEE